MRIDVIIPAYNEQDRIAETVSALARIPRIGRVLVVDDGSRDATASHARDAGAETISLSENRGKGAALDAGLSHLTGHAEVRLLALLDADLGETAAQAEALIAPVVAGEADMTVAAFPRPAGRAGFGLVKKLAAAGIRRLGDPGFRASAPLSGQRVLNSSAIDACTPFATGFGVEVALTVRALRAGLRVVEVPTTMRHAATGRDLAGFAHRGKQFVHVARALLSLARETDDQRSSGSTTG